MIPLSLTVVAACIFAVISVGHAFVAPPFVDFDERLTEIVFDYVIIGGGLSSLAFASAKSLAQPLASILIVEAGGDTREDGLIKYVANYSFAFDNPKYDWSYNTTVQEFDGKSHKIHAGASLGGGSSINNAMYVMPPLSQLDTLFKGLGEASFGGQKLFQHIRKTQNFIEPTQEQMAKGITSNAFAHSFGGTITIGFSSSIQVTENENAFIKAQLDVLGAEKMYDVNDGGEDKLGPVFFPRMIEPESGADRTRVSAATAFVSTPNRLSSCVFILLNTRGVKMQYANALPLRAVSVDLQQSDGGEIISVKASKVIVGAGTFGSPAFLERSGIGGKEILSAAGVSTVLDLGGVGKNLQDHQLALSVLGGTIKKPSETSMFLGSELALNSVEQLMANASEVQAYVQHSIPTWAQDVVNAGGHTSVEGLTAQYNALAKGIFTKSWPISETIYGLTKSNAVFVNIGELPFSRGYTHIMDTSAWSAPQINTRAFTTPFDVDVEVALARASRAILRTKDMNDIFTAPGGEQFPGLDITSGGVRDTIDEEQYHEWTQVIANSYYSVHHPSSTCTMMSEVNGGVVDGGFRVHHTENVYVIGGPVLPFIHSGHPASVLYGLAYAAAATIP